MAWYLNGTKQVYDAMIIKIHMVSLIHNETTPCHIEHNLGNIKMSLHILQFLNIEVAQAVEMSHWTQRPFYPAQDNNWMQKERGHQQLSHWGRVTHIHISKLTIIGSDNGLVPGWHQAIIWTNAGILLIWTLGTNFSEIVGEIHTFSFKKMHLKLLSAKWWQLLSGPQCVKVSTLSSQNIPVSSPECFIIHR